MYEREHDDAAGQAWIAFSLHDLRYFCFGSKSAITGNVGSTKKKLGTYSNRDSYPVANQRGVDETNLVHLRGIAG